MSDHLADSPALGIAWCPTCNPTMDPTRQILETRYCDAHAPDRSGDADASVLGNGEHIGYSAEADGAVCREAQKLIR